MAKLSAQQTVGVRDGIVTVKLGTAPSVVYAVDADRYKALKEVADSRVEFTADGNEIDGFLHSLETFTAEGYQIGSMFIGFTTSPITARATGALAYGDYVVSAAGGLVKKAPGAATALTQKWKVVGGEIAGTGERRILVRKV